MIEKSIQQKRKRSILATKDNSEYERLSEEIRINIAKGAKVWIPELAEKLKKKYLSENELNEDEKLERNRRIQDRIMDDWGDGKPWTNKYLNDCMPEWIRNPLQVEVNKKNTPFSSAKQSKLIEQKKQLENVFKKIEPPSREVIQEIREEVTAPEYTYSKPTVTFEAKETAKEETADPEFLHDDAMRAYARIWEALADRDNLPADSTDVFVDVIKASRNHRLRILKGLDDTRRAGFINQTRWLNMLLEDLLNTDNQLVKEERHVGK